MLTERSDLDLIRASRTKPETPESRLALETLAGRYKALVCKIARRYFLLSGGDTDDLIQEGMIGLLKAVFEYDPERDASFGGYATVCIRNKIVSAVRTYNRRSNRALNDALPIMTEDGAEEYLVDVSRAPDDPIETYIDRERSDALRQAIDTLLSPRQKAVLQLYLEGYSYKEIAARLALSEKSVDNAVMLVKRKIKQKLDA